MINCELIGKDFNHQITSVELDDSPSHSSFILIGQLKQKTPEYCQKLQQQQNNTHFITQVEKLLVA